MQKQPSVLACDIANPFPPDLWGYVHGFGYHNGQYLRYGKSLSAGPCEVLSIDLAIIVTIFICRYWSTTTRKGQVYKNDTRCTKGIRKYETDGRYPSQYGFHIGAGSWQLARDLSSWCGAPGSLHWHFDPTEN